MDTIKVHAPNFDCDNDGGSGGPIAADHDVSTGPDTAFLTDFVSLNTKAMTKDKAKDTLRQLGLDWQTEKKLRRHITKQAEQEL